MTGEKEGIKKEKQGTTTSTWNQDPVLSLFFRELSNTLLKMLCLPLTIEKAIATFLNALFLSIDLFYWPYFGQCILCEEELEKKPISTVRTCMEMKNINERSKM